MARRNPWAAVLLVVAFSSLPAFAQVGFNGGGDGSTWEDPLNWTGGSLPTNSSGQTFIGGGPDGSPILGITPATVSLSSDQNIDEIRIGSRPGGVGTVNHSAGTLNTNWVFAGIQGAPGQASSGTYNLSGTATLDSFGNVQIFGADNSDSSGHLTIADEAHFSGNETWIGLNGGAVGTATQTGGSVAIGPHDEAGNPNGAELRVGGDNGGNGTYSISGGSLDVVERGIFVGKNDGGIGRINVTGSTASINTTNLTVGGFLDGVITDLLTPVDTTGYGVLSFTADAHGVSPIVASGDVFLGGGASLVEASGLVVNLNAMPTTGPVLLVDVGGTRTGEFFNAPEGTLVANSGGRVITYTFGDGNDIALVPEPAVGCGLLLGLVAWCGLRRKR